MTVEAHKETLGFQAEVKQLLRLVINSLYSNKEIFLRELISNASDAVDKLRFAAIADPNLYAGDTDLKIRVAFDDKKKTITVSDNGIGMSREEVTENLGTIAKSGTREFFEALTGDQSKDAQLIGQFGVGFYSSFIVADKVTVLTRRAGLPAEEGVCWESGGEGDYSLETIEKPERGTEIILHLRDGEDEFLSDFRLRKIITKYSDHISTPVVMKTEVFEEISEEEGKEEGDEAKDKEPKEKKYEDEVVNRAKALWTLPKSEIKESDYQEFYKHISHDLQDPLTWAHNKVEGKMEYTSLLYIPGHAPFDLWNRDHPHGLRLYVQRVFIMDEVEQFLPLYLRFVKGIVDSNDLPLNVSREILQGDKKIDSMRSALTKRILGMLEKMAKDDKEQYSKFWKEFGGTMKEGPAEDFANREQVAKLLRFSSTHDDKEEQEITLEDYVSRMREGQDKIYFVSAESFNGAKNSPHLEIFRKKGIEVLLLSDRVDEWLVAHLPEFDGKQLQSVAKGSLDLGELDSEAEKEEVKKAEDEFKGLVEHVKKVMGERIKEVRLTHRLTSSPACIVADENDMGIQMQRILQAAGQAFPEAKPIFELNPEHAIVQRLRDEQDDDRFSEWTNILFDQAVLAEGGHLDDPAGFVHRLNGLLLELAK